MLICIEREREREREGGIALVQGFTSWPSNEIGEATGGWVGRRVAGNNSHSSSDARALVWPAAYPMCVMHLCCRTCLASGPLIATARRTQCARN